VVIPLPQTLAINVWGSAHKLVHCEYCSKDYIYGVKRRGQGEGTCVIYLDEEWVTQRATRLANADLQRSLNAAVEVAPCPGCGWIQTDMLVVARSQHLPRLRIAGSVLLIGLVISVLVFFGVWSRPANDPRRNSLMVEITIVAVLHALAAAICLKGRSIACASYDPNSEDVEFRKARGLERGAMLADLKSKQPPDPGLGGMGRNRRG
jgi:hypothetical protein